MIYPAADEAGIAKATQEVFNDLQGYLEGSKQVAAKKKGSNALQDSIDQIAEVLLPKHGQRLHNGDKLSA